MNDSKKPTHIAYTVRDYTDADGKPNSAWSRIGAAWAHNDLNGVSIVLDAIPVNGRINLRVASEKPKEADDSQAA